MVHQDIILLPMVIPCLHLLYLMIHIEHLHLPTAIHHLLIIRIRIRTLNILILLLDLLPTLRPWVTHHLLRHMVTLLGYINQCRPILLIIRILTINIIRILRMATIDRLLPSTRLVHGMSENEIRKIVDLYLQVLHLPPWIGQAKETERGI
jgi:hypothetical protein